MASAFYVQQWAQSPVPSIDRCSESMFYLQNPGRADSVEATNMFYIFNQDSVWVFVFGWLNLQRNDQQNKYGGRTAV